MKGNLSKKKGLESSISNDHLDYIAGKLGDTLLNPKILAFLNIANQYQKTELYQTLIELLESLEEQKADSDDLPTKLSQLENDPEFVTQKIVDAVISRVKALEDKDWSDLELDQYQKKLTFDDTPTPGSNNPVTSDGVFNTWVNLENIMTSKTQSMVDKKVDKETGKGLSSNDYTDAEKQKNANNEANIATLILNKADNDTLIDYVKFTDYATTDKFGVVKVSEGLYVVNGKVAINPASKTMITTRSLATMPIVPSSLNFAVKAALSDNNRISDMTDAEKANARDVIGAEQKTTIVPWPSTSTEMSVNFPAITECVQICDHEITALSLGVSGQVPVGYECSFTFQSGATATTITYPGNMFKFVGVDCDVDGDFVASASTNYEISVRNLSTDTETPLLVARVGVY